MNTRLCVCGCPADVHQHNHAGTYCGHCGALLCPKYQRPRWWRKRRVTT